jgi:hypothetical protein
MEKKDELEELKQTEFFTALYPEMDMDNFVKRQTQPRVTKIAVTIPPIKPVGAAPEAGGVPPLPGTAPAPGAIPPPAGAGVGTAVPPPPAGGPPMGDSAGPGMPPMGDSAGLSPMNPPQPSFSEEDKDKLDSKLEDLKNQLKSMKNELNMDIVKEELINEFRKYYRSLEEELKSLKEKQIPERKYFDTEGAYRDTLYGMATRLLDEFLPDLCETVPDYSFIATQVSRMFDDGTICDAKVVMLVTVPRDGMKYEFKVEIPVLNGLMQYPMYIERGQKMIPLTKDAIMRELNSMSYRRLDVDKPYDKANIFNNIGENLHRRPDDQKWIEVSPNSYKPVGLPPISKYPTQRGRSQ